MSPALNGSSVIWHFKHRNAIEIRDEPSINIYTGLPHIQVPLYLAAVAIQRGNTVLQH